MKTPRMLVGWSLLALLAGPASVATAQESGAAYTSYEDRIAEEEGAVFGRLRYVEGMLTLRRDSQLTTDLVINDPVAPGDVITTPSDGRAEIQLADGSLLRLDADSELILTSLWDASTRIENATILQLGYGSMIIRSDDMDSNEKRFQVDTDSASIFVLSEGLYRIDVRPDGSTAVSTLRGMAEVSAEGVSSIARSGERIVVHAGELPGQPRVFNTRLGDDFEAWSQDRDDALLRRARGDETYPEELPEAVEPYAGELSYYGNWYNSPVHGWVWTPAGIASDWQPYYYGRWVWSPTGLVWVSYEPWGWAPFHYGRWDHLPAHGWVWIPGRVFGGAYVAWSVSPGYFGWCPLGFYDRPVAWSFGFRTSPWIYVRGHHLYERRVHTVIVRDVNVVRDIERRRIVVRGHPHINPRRVKEAPRVTEEFYKVARERPQLQLPQGPSVRGVSFREQERQRLAVANERKRTGRTNGRSVSSGNGGRGVAVAPGGRTVTVPRGTRATSPRPATGRKAQPGIRGGQSRQTPPAGAPPAATRGQSGRAPTTGSQPRVNRSRPGQTPPAGSGSQRFQGSRPREEQVQPRARRGGNSLPERVIPRIIPQPRGDNGRQGGAPPREVRGQSSRKPMPARPAPSAQRTGGRPPAQKAAPQRAPSSGKESSSKGSGGKGNNKGNKN